MARAKRNGKEFVLDRASVRAVDRAAIEEYGIPGIVLMENAARALTREARDMLGRSFARRAPVLIVCGAGNNGGDGWALARHLHNAGVGVVVAPLGTPRPDGDAGINCAIVRHMGLPEIDPATDDALAAHTGASLVVDAIFGTGLDRPVRGRAAEVIAWINETRRPVLAVDLPSGLDCDTGEPLGCAVKATRTVTFVGHKPGFGRLPAQPYVGDIVVGDIGAPRELTERFGEPLPPQPERRGPSGSRRRDERGRERRK